METIHDYPDLDQQLLSGWQSVVETLARVARVPSAILTRDLGEFIEVISSADVEGNPYQAGMRVKPRGHYCQTVIRESRRLHVKHAPTDPEWSNAPEIEYGMVSYLGYPLHWPDENVFGTICVLDKKSNEYDSITEEVMLQFKRLVESHLALLIRERELKSKLNQIKELHGILPICADCKKIRDDEGYWTAVEEYFTKHGDVLFSHGLCPSCLPKYEPA